MSADEQSRPIEEPASRSATIAVSMVTVAGFIGPAERGPEEQVRTICSLAEFTDVYGAGRSLTCDDGTTSPNFLWHAVRAFFAEGGARACVVRTRPAGEGPARYEAALQVLEGADEVSIVAAPGSTYVAADGPMTRAAADEVSDLLVRHAERMRYRIAVLDSVNGLDVDGIRAERARINSSFAALFYPWVRGADPETHGDVLLPPSGFVAGVYARADAHRGATPPADDDVMRSGRGVERVANAGEAASLNEAGINTLRLVSDRGVIVWGGRTASTDPEWRYVKVRRYGLALERALTQGLRWAVFEPNGEVLWAAVRRSVEACLSAEWRRGALLGQTAAQAWFVRCDRSTMTQGDLDDGRLVCVVGVALIRPAEFVIIRIGLWTADHRP